MYLFKELNKKDNSAQTKNCLRHQLKKGQNKIKNNFANWIGLSGPEFTKNSMHRLWLIAQAQKLFDFFQSRVCHPSGGFLQLQNDGRPIEAIRSGGTIRYIHESARLIHCFVMAHQLGLPGADKIIDHGMDFLCSRHRDKKKGGYFWSLDDNGPVDGSKQAYGHAFVLLAASSAKIVRHPKADELFDDIPN